MSARWIIPLLIWFLLLEASHMDSGDASGGNDDDWDDSDHAGDKLRNKLMSKALGYISNITKNVSDFHYVARDDHEVIWNLERELKKKSRKLGAKGCWRKCQRTLKCFEQLAKRPKLTKAKCDVCIAKCSTTGSNQTQNVGR